MTDPVILRITDLEELEGSPSSGSMFIVWDEEETIESKKVKRVSVANARPSLVEILAAVYPIGSIYISTVATNPATLFGFGTWEAYGAGRVLVGYDAGQAEFNSIGKTGGAKTHTLSIGEIPTHQPVISEFPIWMNQVATGSGSTYGIDSFGNKLANPIGGGQAHNNLQPYITVNIWRRTA